MKSLITFLVLVMICACGFTQNYKYGKVSKEELMETQNDLFPEASATVLYREHKSYFEYRQGEGFTLYTTVFERIKIYDNDGFEWGNHEFYTYNNGSNREKVESLKATTYNLDGKSISKDKMSKSAVFEERASSYYLKHKFTVPNMKAGSVIEFVYTVSSPFRSIDDIYLQYTIPIKKEVVEVMVPEYYVYRNIGNPQSSLNYNYEQSMKEMKVSINSRSGIGSANYNGNNDSNRSGNDGGTGKYKQIQYKLEESNIPPLKKEGYVDNINNYRAKTIWELVMVNWPGEMPKSYSTDWESVTETIYNRDVFVNELDKKGYFEADLDTAIAGLTDPLDKAKGIYTFVKKRMTWDGKLSYYPLAGVKNAYKDGAGNVGDINLMLISMLRSSNLNANPVLISTKSNGVPVFPTLNGFNYVIAGLELNGKFYLMDATSPSSDINLLPNRAINWQGRLIRPDGTSAWVGLYPELMSQDIVYAQAEISGTELTANVRERLTGHYAKDYRYRYVEEKLDTQLEALQPGENIATYTDLEVKDLEIGKPFVNLSYNASSGTIVEEINGDLYVAPMLFLAHLENPFKADKRDYPIFFGYPKTEKYNITLKIPEGYQVTSLPESSKASLGESMGSYTYLIKEAPGMVQLSVTLELKSPIVLAEDYTYVKGMFSELVNKESEKIVLSKI